MQLTDATIDQNKAGHGPLLFQNAAVPASHRFAHASEIVVLAEHRKGVGGCAVASLAANDELAIIGLFHPAVFPDDHRSYRVRARSVGDIEAFDATRLFQ